MPPTHADPLLDHLLEEGRLTAAQVEEVYDEHGRTGVAVRQILLDSGIFTEDELNTLIAEALGVEVVDLTEISIPTETYAVLTSDTARMYNVVPVDAEPSRVTIATYQYPGANMVDELHFLLGREVAFVIARKADIEELLLKHYGEDSASISDMYSALESELAGAGEKSKVQEDITAESLESAASQAPVIKFVNLVLLQAVQARASDIHFEPFEHDFRIRYRVDGALYEMAPPPKHLALAIISRVKVISGLNISERRLPQDGRIQLTLAGRSVDFRVSCLPTVHGESVVLRVLDQTGGVGLELESLGMPDDVHAWFLDDIQKPNGIILVTGPTGSGKTTTLYSALKRLNTLEDKLLTAEEPVEYNIDGIVQVPVNEKIGVTFASCLRAFLRQDPDIILVGEIRDMETAQIAIQASLTGHLVFSTLHTNDAAGSISRLIDMGVEPFLMASSIESVMATRLVRTICKECKTPYQPSDEVLVKVNLTRKEVGDRPFHYGKGCLTCNQTGYKGRRGIYEYLRVSEPIRRLITEKKPTLIIRDRARQLGMRTLREDGVRCILDGYTTVEEVLKYT
jgi:type IV pilus assembly protein PilB